MPNMCIILAYKKSLPNKLYDRQFEKILSHSHSCPKSKAKPSTLCYNCMKY